MTICNLQSPICNYEARMPFQNRVGPFGEVVATTARGTLMGNRGCLHDDGDRPLRQYQGRRWIICVLDFKGRTRQPMPPGHYTSLFFLDEATALAAGHRPCAECQRERFSHFRAHWAAANPELAGGATPLVETIDTALHHERISDQRLQRDKIKLTYSEKLDRLPDGVFVVLETGAPPYLVRGSQLFAWSFIGYSRPIARHGATVQVLTPRSIVRAIAHGYAPLTHPSARGAA
jgi:hypothetical protein